MTLDDTARERLDDVRELEPTSNGELAKRWGMESGKEVARYLREELDGFVYRDEDSRIRMVADADSSASTDRSENTAEHDNPETHSSPEGDGSGENSDTSRDDAVTGDSEPVNNEEPPSVQVEVASESSPSNTPELAADMGHDPSLDTPPSEEPDTDPTDAALEAAKEGCQQCGGEIIDCRETNLLKREDGLMIDAPDDFYCSECGRGMDWIDGEPEEQARGSGGGVLLGLGAVALGVAVGIARLFSGSSDRDDRDEPAEVF